MYIGEPLLRYLLFLFSSLLAEPPTDLFDDQTAKAVADEHYLTGQTKVTGRLTSFHFRRMLQAKSSLQGEKISRFRSVVKSLGQTGAGVERRRWGKEHLDSWHNAEMQQHFKSSISDGSGMRRPARHGRRSRGIAVRSAQWRSPGMVNISRQIEGC